MNRPVTEQDFRKPEFRGQKPEDYEFREDGAVVRKDRWQTAIHRIRCTVGPKGREFEIVDVVKAVERLAGNWQDAEPDEDPVHQTIDLRLSCGTVLARCERGPAPAPFTCHWQFGAIDFTSKDFGADVIEWQESPPPPAEQI
ncbi:hypothetical protein [Pseudomonas sp. BF-R-01]|uniref:hypothetical protein n=1 Tax=Pseudomonas sp. BF-R-01 TaxID=2832365 RepID=UPI001CBE9AAE|nr:hypothetical protein [Pseudomonas sp. BF-R-01]